ncbi:MAG: apolipoprotein N-acyltransferase [Rickettsiaceae bacterium]
MQYLYNVLYRFGYKDLALLLPFILGCLCASSFAPLFFAPGLIALSVFCALLKNAKNLRQAIKCGFWFKYGYFFASLYWISIAISVYIDDFWWMMPITIIGLPVLLSCFIIPCSIFSWIVADKKYYHLVFCISWVLCEFLRSWMFTGFPWNLLGYAFTFSDILIQTSSLWGIYGLSFIVIYISSSLYLVIENKTICQMNDDSKCYGLIGSSCLIMIIIVVFGMVKLYKYPNEFLEFKFRLVQPSIQQHDKWSEKELLGNLDKHIAISKLDGDIDTVIWSEAALNVPYNLPIIKEKIQGLLSYKNANLITGSIGYEQNEDSFKLYNIMQAISHYDQILFTYAKSHLVPFGEYIPFSDILPLQKITKGIIDYSPGIKQIVYLDSIAILPLICYESIFSDEVQLALNNADVIINVTNDAWFGNSSGPYQHLHIARMRAVENGIPILRVANNGISAVIDSNGSIIASLGLNYVGKIDSKLPSKLPFSTIYSKYGISTILIAIIFVSIVYFISMFCIRRFANFNTNHHES